MAHAVGVRLKEVGKFVEQGWQVMYYAGAFSVGFYLMNKWEFDVGCCWCVCACVRVCVCVCACV